MSVSSLKKERASFLKFTDPDWQLPRIKFKHRLVKSVTIYQKKRVYRHTFLCKIDKKKRTFLVLYEIDVS